MKIAAQKGKKYEIKTVPIIVVQDKKPGKISKSLYISLSRPERSVARPTL
jgi:hypothetical protein